MTYFSELTKVTFVLWCCMSKHLFVINIVSTNKRHDISVMIMYNVRIVQRRSFDISFGAAGPSNNNDRDLFVLYVHRV